MEVYLQTTSFTTAASSLLTILKLLDPNTVLTKEQEFEIWRKTVNLPTRASSIFALANYAKSQGIDLKVTIDSKEYDFPDYRFYRYKKEEIEQARFSSEQYLKKSEKNNVNIEEKEISFADLKKKIKESKAILIRLNTKPIRNEKRNTSNFMVLLDYFDNYFHLFDPALGGISIPEEIMRIAFETLNTKKFRNHQMIEFF